MSAQSAAVADRPAAKQAADGVVIARKDQATYVTGRRDWMKYRELGVTKASKGRIRAQVTSTTQGLSEPTGWHVHLCEGQIVYMLSGWVDLEFAGGRVERVGAGDSVYIPGNTPTTKSPVRMPSSSWKSASPPTWVPSPATRPRDG